MRIISLEDHVTTDLYESLLPSPGEEGARRRKAWLEWRSAAMGYDIKAELADMGESRIAAMDKAGVDLQVLSLTTPGAQGLDAVAAVRASIDANDRMAAAVERFPDRLLAFAALPTPDPDASVRELRRTVEELGFKGAMINGHANGRFLDAKEYDPLFDCAQQLDVPLYIHPREPAKGLLESYFKGYEDLARAPIGFGIDAGLNFVRLMFSGVFDRFPGLRIILGHLGEGLPFVMTRLNHNTKDVRQLRGLKKEPIEYFCENLVLTTSGNYSVPSFLCTSMMLGTDSIMFSVDWPYEPNTDAVAFLKSLPINEADRAKIAHANAERILKIPA